MVNSTFMSKHEIGHGLIWSAVVQCESLAGSLLLAHTDEGWLMKMTMMIGFETVVLKDNLDLNVFL